MCVAVILNNVIASLPHILLHVLQPLFRSGNLLMKEGGAFFGGATDPHLSIHIYQSTSIHPRCPQNNPPFHPSLPPPLFHPLPFSPFPSSSNLERTRTRLVIQCLPFTHNPSCTLQLGLLGQRIITQVNGFRSMLCGVAAPCFAPQPLLWE